LIYVGEVHILSEASYLIKIYKLIHKYKTKQITRMLEEYNSTGEASANSSKANWTDEAGNNISQDTTKTPSNDSKE
jgi:REP element-mobilizing transposase RayT